MTQALTISQLARATGVAARTIRYYEQVGVLPSPRRTAAGYRQYDRLGVHRLRFIARARSLGLPHAYLGYYVEGSESMAYKADYVPNQLLGPDGQWHDFRR